MTPAPIKPSISFEYLEKIDIRVGTILAVEDVANSDKLVRLKVDFGDHTRSILIGMKKERQNPKAEIEGKQACFCKRRLSYRETIGSDFTPEEPLLCRTRQGSPESAPLQPRAFRGA